MRFPLLRLSALFAALCAAPALAQSQLDLGYYVAAEVPCASASNVSVSLVHWSGINSARSVCEFTSVTAFAQDAYRFVQSCQEIGTDTKYDLAGDILIQGSQAFELRVANGSFRYRYCPQAEMPEPWRSNDLSDYQR